jgi:hypothetical protein
MYISRKAGLQWVERGDCLAYDYTSTDFIPDSAWHVLTLPIFLPLNAKLVQFRVQIQVPGPNYAFILGAVSQPHDYNTYPVYTAYTGSRTTAFPIIPVYNRQIRYWKQNVSPWTQCYLHILGWFM